MSRNPHRLPSSRVLKAYRRLGGTRNQGSLSSAVRTVSAAMQSGITMPRSAVLDLAYAVLDAEVDIDCQIRVAAAKALVAFDEREIARAATRAIRDPTSPLEVVTAAATIFLGSPRRQLSPRDSACLLGKVRRFGQIRGPMVDLLYSSRFSGSMTRRAKQ